MTPEEAKRLLQIHSGRDGETNPEKWENGFLVPLRYSPDAMSEEAFLEVMECIRTLAHEIASSRTVDRELMAALWGLIYLPRAWAFHPQALENLVRCHGRRRDGQKLSRLADRLDRIAEAVDFALYAMPESVKDAMTGYGDPVPDYVEAVGRHQRN